MALHFPELNRRDAARVASLSGPFAAAGASLAAFALVAVVDPNEPGRYLTCPFLAVTDHYCPGCGSLRAMHALSRGQVDVALGLNVLTVSALPLLGYLWLRWVRRRWLGQPRPNLVDPAYLWVGFAVVLLFWLVRNLPFGSVLAP